MWILKVLIKQNVYMLYLNIKESGWRFSAYPLTSDIHFKESLTLFLLLLGLDSDRKERKNITTPIIPVILRNKVHSLKIGLVYLKMHLFRIARLETEFLIVCLTPLQTRGATALWMRITNACHIGCLWELR